MRYYLIDEISKSDLEKLKNHLSERALKSGLDDIYWVEFPDDLLTQMQSEHHACKPHVFGLEFGDDSLRAELFVRNRNQFGCACQQYCDDCQKNYVINFVLSLINELNIRT
jgi:hypothetical protein